MLNYKHLQWSDVIDKNLFLLYIFVYSIFNNDVLIITISFFLF